MSAQESGGSSSHFVRVAPKARQLRRWCIFTSAGDRNAVRLWLKDSLARWDLVVAYYGDDRAEFAELTKASPHAFRARGGKWQILKKFLTQNPQFFDQYAYVWICDDDIKMSAAQIDEAFAIAEFFDFWIAQPAFSPRGKVSHAITRYAGPRCDYRAVNFIEENTPIFRRDKLIRFMSAYDGSLTGHGNDWWYMNFFKANELGRFRNLLRPNELGRFAIIDKIQVVNPHDEEKGRREIDQIKPESERIAEWTNTMSRYGLVEFPQKTFAFCTGSSHGDPGKPVTSFHVVRQIPGSAVRKLLWEYKKLSADWRKRPPG